MSRLPIPTVDSAPVAAQPLLAAVKQSLGTVPNLMKLLATSPAALEGYLSLNTALGKGSLEVGLRESIALAIAEYNRCDYCLSAHSYLGQHVAKLSASQINAARHARSDTPRVDAALNFALKIAQQRGRIDEADLATIKLAGFDDAAVLEIVLNVALNVLTNYVNNVARTDIDFPVVQAREAA